MSTKSRGTLQRRDFKTSWISLFQLLIVINCAKAIDYAAHRTDAIPPEITRDIARRTRGLLEQLNSRNVSETHDLQDGTEHLLHYGAILRSEILETFGRLVYEKYDDFSMHEIEALYRIYRETLERRYNIFDIVPKILEDPDTRPTKICSHINRNVRTCLKEISRDCMNVKIDNEPHRERLSKAALNVTKKIYLSAEIPKNYPNGFSPNAVLELLRYRRLRLTPGLFSGLLRNVRYDNFDDGVRTAERKIVSFLAKESKDFIPIIVEYSDSARSVSRLLKNYLGDEEIFHGKIARDAVYLAEHVVREVNAVDQNIELLGTIYDNSTINLGFLFELILPNDTVDRDIVEARDYLLGEIRKKNIIEKYLRVDKYEQSGPDQLILEIFGQLRDIGFAVDIVTSLYSHARFWHRSHMISNLNELLELFEAYDNLRGLPNFSSLVEAADRIKNNLQDSRNVTVELLCTRPRSCLRIGLELVFKCATVNKETKIAIDSFLGRTACDCSLFENSKIVDESRINTKPGDDIAIKTIIEKPREIVEKNTKKSRIVGDSRTSKKPIDVTTEMPREIVRNEKIPFNSSTLIDDATKSFETSTNINDSYYDDDDDNYSNSDERQKRVKKNGKKKLRKATEQPTTSNIHSSKCNGTICIERVVKCRDDNCFVDCSGGDCSQQGNCTGARQCAEVKTMENNCTVNDCPDNTTKDHRDCEGSECVTNSTKIDCKGGNCSKRGNCTGGRRCATAKTLESNCTGNDCPDNTTEVRRDCEGPECAKNLTKIECESGNCSVTSCKVGNCEESNATLECEGEKCFGENNSIAKMSCEGPDCTDALEKIPRHSNCTGPDCSKLERLCTGENCSVKGTQIVPIECKGKDCSTTCEGGDCSAAKYEKTSSSMSSDEASGESDCTGDSCEDYYMTIKCEGSDCPESSIETCEGSDCDNIEYKNDSCNGGDCIDAKNINDCKGFDCSIDKKEDGSSKAETANVSCPGKNCPINVEPPVREKKRSKNSTLPTFSSIVEGGRETETRCPGKNCPTKDHPPIRGKNNSTDSSVPLYAETAEKTQSCRGENCPIYSKPFVSEKRRMKNSTEPKAPSLVEGESKIKFCSGKNCSIDGESPIREIIPTENAMNSSVSSTPVTPLRDANRSKIRLVFCDNSDPHYRRKLNRLRKMRRIDANSSRSRAETWGAIFASSSSVGERAGANMKSEINKKNEKKNPLLRVLGNSELNVRNSGQLIRDRANNDTASRSHGQKMSYEKLRVTNRTELGERENNVSGKLTIEKIGNESSEEQTKMRVEKIRKKLRKNRKRANGSGKGKVRIKTTMVHDKDDDEDNEEIRSKRREEETSNGTKKLQEKLRKDRGARYRIKTTLVKDVSDEDDEVRESDDVSSLEEIIAQRVREQMKKLRQEFRTNSTKLRRGKKLRATRTSRDRDSSKDSSDLGPKDFSTNRERPILKGIISESKNREESIAPQTESQTNSSNRSIRQQVPLRRQKKKYRHKEYIDKNNDSNELEKNITIIS